MLSVFRQALGRRRTSLLWWSLGVLGMDGLLAVAYPTVRGNSELDRTFAGLPSSVQTLLALRNGATLTSPVGYLDSQYYANILPVMLLVLAIGFASWTIAGDENAGMLELLLANPVSRIRVAAGRALALVVLVAAVAAVAAVGLVAMAPPSGLGQGLAVGRIVEATAGTGILSLAYAALAFCVGAATGKRGVATSVAVAVAVAQFVIEGLAEQVKAFRPLRLLSPWHWFLSADPLRNGLGWRAWLLPLLAAVTLVIVGAAAFSRRDLTSA